MVHQQCHRVVEEVDWVVRRVEEEDVAQAEHQAGHGHRQQREHVHRRAQPIDAPRLFQQVGSQKNDHRTAQSGSYRELEAVEEGDVHLGVDQAEGVVA
jgi:hypothetical protein